MANNRRTPKAIKEARGTLDKRWAAENEMDGKLVQSLPVPQHYDNSRQELWLKYTSILADNGILSEMDSELLIMLVDSIAMYQEHFNQIKKEGSVIYDHKDKPIVNPAFEVMNKALTNALRIGQLFGITPFSRAKINVHKKNDLPKDDLFAAI